MDLALFFWHRARWSVVGALISALISGACTTWLFAMISFALSGATGTKWRVPVSFLALLVVVPASRVVSEIILIKLGQDVLRGLRLEFAEKILNLPVRRLEQLGSPGILSVLTDDLPNITNLAVLIPTLSVNGTVVLSCLAYMSWLSSRLFLIVAGLIALGIGSYQIAIFRGVKALRSAREEQNKLLRVFSSLVLGVKELKMHRNRRDSFVQSAITRCVGQVRKLNTSALRIYAMANGWAQVLIFIVLGLLVFIGPAITTVKSPTIISFCLAVLYLIGPLEGIMNATPLIGRATIAMKNIECFDLALANEHPEIVDHDSPPEAHWARIELREVSYVYENPQEGVTFTLGPINLTFAPGEIVFITGGNGSGKTTLAKIISGLYTPVKGQIIWDHQIIAEHSRGRYRQLFSTVFSDFFLFDELFGITCPSRDEKATEYLREFRLAKAVKIHNGHISTTDLSQGQRKRLALLVALLEARPIYLLDEWAAEQDSDFREYFYSHLLNTLRSLGRTVIVITHDAKYLEHADRLVRIEDGRIAEDKEVQRPSDCPIPTAFLPGT